MAVTVNWGAMGLGSVIAFLIGWFLLGSLLYAVVLAIVVMVLMGIIKVR